MFKPNQNLSETHLVGSRCRQNELDSDHVAALKEAPFRWLGYSVLFPPYRMVRHESVHSHIVACVKGRGRVHIDGKWVEFRPGDILLGPIGAFHAFEAVDEKAWDIAWVFYDDSLQHPLVKASKASLVNGDIQDFVNALQMLLRESAGANQPLMMSALTTVLDVSIKRMIALDETDDRLWKLWLEVEGAVASDWTVEKLARIAHVSEEHLRRLCQKYYQRSPVEHLTQLRMRRAATLLKSTSHKVETIAHSVGYGSMYSFSVAFKRWNGVSPREFRSNFK